MTQVRITSSFGVSSLASEACDPLELIDQADKALYSAKETGRNKVVQWESLQTQQDDSVHETEVEVPASPPALAHSAD